MLDFSWLLRTGLGYGMLLSLLLVALMLVSVLVNPEIWVNDYPPEIRSRYGPVSERTRGQRRVFAILFMLVLAGVVALFLQRLYQAERLTFGYVFLGTWTVLMVFNLFDLLVLDWLIFVRIRPAFIVLPGTEGMSAYGDTGFHFRGFLIGSVMTFAVSLLIAGITVLVLQVLT